MSEHSFDGPLMTNIRVHGQVLRPERRVVFLDTDALSAGREELAADAMCNKAEAALLLRVVEALVSGGMLDSAIGAISPYRSQVQCCGTLRLIETVCKACAAKSV